jgi:hypothetical protein
MTKDIEISVETHDKRLSFDLLDSRSISAGNGVEITPGAQLVWTGGIGRKAFGEPEWLTFLLQIAAGVPVTVVSAWLYQKLKGRAQRMSINRTEIEIDEGEIKRIIQEKMDIEGSS